MSNKYALKKSNPTAAEAVGGCALVAIFVVGMFAISIVAMQFVWNLVVPSVFGGPTLDFPQAAGVVLLLTFIGSFFRR